jgi:tetratricopeptide (TPR) repeat protein
MNRRLKGCLITGFLAVFALNDGSGQDARFYGRRADHEWRLGRMSEALKLYHQAYQAAITAGDQQFQYRFLNNIGASELALFRFKDAEQTLLKVRTLAEASHDDALTGSAYGNLAAVYDKIGNLASAETYARESVKAYSRTDKWNNRTRALITLGDILSHETMTREGEQSYRAAIDVATQTREWFGASVGWLHYGQRLMEGGRLDEADRAFASSYSTLCKSENRNGEDAVLFSLALLRQKQGDLKSALVLINSAIKVSPSAGGRIAPWRLYRTRADVQLALGDAKGALRMHIRLCSGRAPCGRTSFPTTIIGLALKENWIPPFRC